jgi:hypothetical protein
MGVTMINSKALFFATTILYSIMLQGCGTFVPAIREPWDNVSSGAMELNIVNRVYCELKRAVIDASHAPPTEIRRHGRYMKEPLLPDNWGVQYTLTLTVDEKTTLGPGVTFNTPIIPATVYFPGGATAGGPQNYSFGLGGKLEAGARRIDKFDFYYSVERLKIPVGPATAERPEGVEDQTCTHNTDGSSFLLTNSDLGIREWLRDSLQTRALFPPSEGVKAPAQVNSLTYQITFKALSEGTASPSWSLVRVSANTGQNLFGTNRERAHDLTITFGPAELIPGQKRGLPPVLQATRGAADAHLASQIGLSVANNLRDALRP